ncbi:GDP-fucose synthetase [bacterium (Candidatus Blackallbacteria) CG17_big_fil_post_rev_8_21_14_2_50_48_46]|uniref:GDP-L-fucose synthase n=1 Tax=bacterium (Candidatus Blackallbacteria) CG17_big_fil_post_rev_8_21_14_2_50_48_46 TaxID=2014261 RepID=A0A2M7GBB7_9BACT|nr:MAG: GDP-fucose synthetase [bacterium (Candidatus Blackallbacteria) CG18_big_fil_WC_8_21_14_2_50_49_26]PIW19476.1 MAG: GDP-fucose synthetase [bacterium (Candidatus Blackallbacteria) CG17_big_fil_post_rev_8_21_14_2_50_48_46]PIW48920.1 MAG: GDP-fucose synthetase [bacterium (Candidatus Blackallbacteria) CG13_big_fil_rev_8_21_14_2_50_49_14]
MPIGVDFWHNRKVLVTGGNGFIGSFTVEKLVAAGAHVTTTSSLEENRFRFLENVKNEIDTRVGNLEDETFARACCQGQELVLHLAARVGGIEFNRLHPGSLFRDNMRAFLSTLEAARQEEVRRFLVTSSACVYPRNSSIPTPEEEGFKETPEPTNAGYGWSKRMQEYMAQAYVEEFGMDIVVARPFNAYGPRDDFDPQSSHVIAGLVHKIEQGINPLVVWGDGSASRSFLYVEDFANGLLTVAEKAQGPEAFNLGADEEITIRDLASLLVELSGRSLELIFDTSKPNGQPRRHCDNRKALEKLGFQTETPLREGLLKTLQWYREHKGKSI